MFKTALFKNHALDFSENYPETVFCDTEKLCKVSKKILIHSHVIMRNHTGWTDGHTF